MDISTVAIEYMTIMRSIIESGKQAAPILCVFKQNDSVDIILIKNMQTIADKNSVSFLLQQKVAEENTLFCIFIAETWIYKSENKSALEKKQQIFGSLQYVPGRQEAIIATICGRGMTPSVGHWIFDRDKNNKPVFEEKPSFSSLPDTTGRFIVATEQTANS